MGIVPYITGKFVWPVLIGIMQEKLKVRRIDICERIEGIRYDRFIA